MAEELAQLPTPALPKGQGRIGFKEAIGVQEPFLRRKAELQPQITAAEGNIAKAQQAQKEQAAYGKSVAQEQFVTDQEAAQKAYQEKIEKEPLPAFVPTKDTAQDIAGLFGLISVIGMLVGGEGKMAGMRAMGAMDGMLKGYREGRADLYKKERAEFEANFKTMLKKHEEFRKEMDDAIKLAATNKEAGMAAAELAAVKAGSPIVQAQLRKGDLVGAYKLVDESQKGAQEALKLEGSAREAEARERAAQKRHQEQLAQQRALAEAKGAGRGATQQVFMAQRAVNALGGVASAMETIGKLPSGTTAGILPNLTTKDGMTNFMRNAAARTMTDSESKAVETLFTGVTRNLAAIEASGAATGLVGLATQLEKLRPVAGDKAVDVALKMADIRRVATENIQPLIDSGLMPKDQQQTAAALVERIKKAVPYTTEEVVDAAFGKKGKETITQAGARIVAPTESAAYQDPEKEARYQKWLKENPQ